MLASILHLGARVSTLWHGNHHTNGPAARACMCVCMCICPRREGDANKKMLPFDKIRLGGCIHSLSELAIVSEDPSLATPCNRTLTTICLSLVGPLAILRVGLVDRHLSWSRPARHTHTHTRTTPGSEERALPISPSWLPLHQLKSLLDEITCLLNGRTLQKGSACVCVQGASLCV